MNFTLLDGVVLVTDQDITTAMAFAFRHLKVVAEPSGACALAAVLAGVVPHDSGAIGLVISGGGVDLPTFHRLITNPTPEGTGPCMNSRPSPSTPART